MKQQRTNFIRSGRNTLFGLALLAISSILLPQGAQAAVSAGASIFNEASVVYDFLATPGISQTSTGVSVTVATLAAAPTVTVTPLIQTTIEGGNINYVYTIRSNSNGPDTYTETLITTTDSAEIDSASPSIENFPTPSITLWGGIVVACQGVVADADEICLPAGAQTGLAGTDTVNLNGNLYTVGTITAGTVQSSGAAEVTTKIQLVDDITTHGIAASSAAAGDPVGEYGTLTMNQTAGTLTAPNPSGTHTTNVTFETTGTDINNLKVSYTTSLGAGNEVITTVAAPAVTFAKAASVLTAKPGEPITYTLTVTNNGAAPVDNVVVSDTAPNYTTLLPGTTTLNGVATGEITLGVPVGTLAPAGVATITFDVRVNP
jgi:uncharacterized repeat protein (TIGR01451 family)